MAVELQRLRPDGRVDSSFGINGYVSVPSGGYESNSLPGLDTLSDGRIVVAGMGYVQWTSSAMLMRFLRNGKLDSSFGNNGKTYPFASDFCRDMALQKDGKILAPFGGFNGNSLFRFQSDGTLDLTYGQGGECELPQRTAYFKLLDSGKIICAGSDGAFVVAQLKPDGIGPDSSFGTYGITRTDITPNKRDRIWTMIVQPDGNILAAGQSRALDNSWWDRLTMVRYHGTPPVPPTNSVASISLPAPELYPNPSSTTFTLRGIVPGLFGNSYQITNTAGQIILRGTLPRADTYTIDISLLPAGLYYLRYPSASLPFIKQ